MTPKVTIIIPVYNAERTLPECLDSIINQSLHEIEVLCIDDGSTDSSSSILRDYSANDARIKLFHNEGKGAAAARNLGIQKSDGQYLMFMDSDDLYPDQYVLERLYKKAVEENVDISGGNYILFDKDWYSGKKSPPISVVSASLLMYNGRVRYDEYGTGYGFTRFLYKAELLKKHNVLFPAIGCWEDHVFMTKAFSAAGVFWADTSFVYAYRFGLHKKEDKVQDFFDLLSAADEMMSVAAEHRNRKLADEIIQILEDKKASIARAYSVDANRIKKGLSNIQNNLKSTDLGIDSDSIQALNEAYYDEIVSCLNAEILKLKTIIESGLDIVVYGAGPFGEKLEGIVRREGGMVKGFAVTGDVVDISEKQGLPVLPYKQWKEKVANPFFVIAVKNESSREMIEGIVRADDYPFLSVGTELLGSEIEDAV